MSIPQRKQVNARSIQAFKPVKDFSRIEGNNAVLPVIFAWCTKPFKRIFVQRTDEFSPGIAVVGDEPLNPLYFLGWILV
ncbi:hypothetical protein [Rothia mucilaginosa]|uniref:hypothetical protein n=1 Tax=Rothia mucilaginosa TaxID=43675 RepID=UPI0026E9724D|nr:hypothetical protein [Rothia mucilaginosa]